MDTQCCSLIHHKDMQISFLTSRLNNIYTGVTRIDKVILIIGNSYLLLMIISKKECLSYSFQITLHVLYPKVTECADQD